MFTLHEKNIIYFLILDKIQDNFNQKNFLEKSILSLDSKEKLFKIYKLQLDCLNQELLDLKVILEKTGDF